MINCRATRQKITQTSPNNYAVPLLLPLIFEASHNVLLSATETSDSIVFNFNVLLYALLSVTEESDTISATSQNLVSVNLSQTDNIDTAEFENQLLLNFELEQTDPQDIANITAQNLAALNAELNVNEAQDTARIYTSQSKKSDNLAALLKAAKRLKKSSVKLQASEAQDVAKFEVEKESNIKARISESGDGIVFTAHVKQNTEFNITENGDGSRISEEDINRFKNYVDEVYRRYEENQIRIFLAVA